MGFKLKASDKGFTLIEIMVTMLIVSVALLALAGLLIGTMKNNHKSEQRMEAAMVSQAVLMDYANRLTAGLGIDGLDNQTQGAWPPVVGAPAVIETQQGDYGFILTVTANGNKRYVLSIALDPVPTKGRLTVFTNQTVVSTADGVVP